MLQNYPALNKMIKVCGLGVSALVSASAVNKIWHDPPWWAYIAVVATLALAGLIWHWYDQFKDGKRVKRLNQLKFPDGTTAKLCFAVGDLLTHSKSNSACISISLYDQKRVHDWAERLLSSLHDILKSSSGQLPADSYVIWMKKDEATGKIKAFAWDGLDNEVGSRYPPFDLGDGLAGKTWKSGEASLHSIQRPNPQFAPLPNCKNASYIAVCVGKEGGLGGIIGFGSNAGFVVSTGQIKIIEAYAAMLALVAEAKPSNTKPET